MTPAARLQSPSKSSTKSRARRRAAVRHHRHALFKTRRYAGSGTPGRARTGFRGIRRSERPGKRSRAMLGWLKMTELIYCSDKSVGRGDRLSEAPIPGSRSFCSKPPCPR